jgi:hypothetical protein
MGVVEAASDDHGVSGQGRIPRALIAVWLASTGTWSAAADVLPALDDLWSTTPLAAIEESRSFAVAKVNVRREQCMRAFGHDWFCDCLRNNLGVGITFRQYVLFTMHSAAELGYADWTPQERAVADHVWNVRDLCVADSY